MFDGICEAIQREMDKLDEKYASGASINGQELEHIDRMAHTLKSIASYEVMLKGCEDSSRDRGRTMRYIREDYPREYRRY